MTKVYKELGQGCLFLPYLLLGAVLSVVVYLLLYLLFLPVVAIIRVLEVIRYRRLRTRMSTAGRLIDGRLVKDRISAGRGTLIIDDFMPCMQDTAWWTEDNLATQSPVPLESFEVQDNYATGQAKEDLIAFTQECINKYLDPQHGKALLVDAVKGWRSYIDVEGVPESAKVVTINRLEEKPKIYLGLINDL